MHISTHLWSMIEEELIFSSFSRSIHNWSDWSILSIHASVWWHERSLFFVSIWFCVDNDRSVVEVFDNLNRFRSDHPIQSFSFIHLRKISHEDISDSPSKCNRNSTDLSRMFSMKYSLIYYKIFFIFYIRRQNEERSKQTKKMHTERERSNERLIFFLIKEWYDKRRSELNKEQRIEKEAEEDKQTKQIENFSFNLILKMWKNR